jgi:phosphoglucosamine mutase
MTRKLFGTDGIRGRANQEPMTATTALSVAMAAAQLFRRGEHRHRVVIGKDTRLSGYLLEPALTAGFIAQGMDVILLGPLPTPAVAMLTKSLRADLGVMISASHNPYEDNGIKLFGPDGYKLSDELESKIEAQMTSGASELAPSAGLGKAARLDDAIGRYVEFVKGTSPNGLRLDGMKIVVDCANGAAYKVRPDRFVGTRRGRYSRRRQSGRQKHQSPLRRDLSRSDARSRFVARRGCGDCFRRRCGPPHHGG